MAETMNLFEAVAKRIAPQAFEFEQSPSPVAEESKQQQGAKVIQLPIWPDSQRRSPSIMVRSALFTATSDRAKRPVLREKPIASWGDSEIQYSGPLLTQYDADVWYQLLHLYRLQGVKEGGRIFFTARSFLKAMGRKYSGYAANTLADSINRLYVCGLGIRVGTRVVASSHRLVRRYGRDDETARWWIELEPLALQLFDNGYTQFDRAQRLQLRTSTAKYLQTYVSSHRATEEHPHRIGLDQLRQLLGQSSDRKRFRRNVRAAMDELKVAGVVSRWRFTQGGALEVVNA